MASKKKYIRRRIVKQKTVHDRFPIDYNEQIEAILAAEQKRYKYVSFGLCTDLKAEYDLRKQRDDIQWSSMKVYFSTPYLLEADVFYRDYEKRDNFIPNNKLNFRPELFDERPTFYLYVMVGRKKKSTKKSYMYKLPEHEPIRVFEGFAGYGGATFGLRRAGINHQVVGFSEFDEDAIELYQYNFPDVKNFGDITKIDANDPELPDFDLFTGGFPCQPFSTVGKRQGEADERGRGTLFGDIIRICEVKKPRYILLENVKGLRTGKMKATFEIILSELKRIGYDVRHAVLNSMHYGIPQTRERLWIFGYLGELPKEFNIEPEHLPLQGPLYKFLDKNPGAELYKSQKQIARMHEIHNHPEGLFDVDRPLCYDVYNRKLRYDDLCMTVTPPEHNVIRIVEPMKNGEERFRKLSLDEHFRLMGFKLNSKTREIRFPETQNYTKLGRRAGNGWDINLVGVLLNHIFKQLL